MTAWVGLSGGIGSGKSAAALLFRQRHGVPCLDADEVSRRLTADGGAALPAIRSAFGDGFFDFSGSLNRSLLREKVFHDAAAKERLEAVLHPLIFDALRQEQRRHDGALYGIVEIPLLTEQPLFQTLVQRILMIDCSEALQMRRVGERSGLSRDMICRILSMQATRQQRLALADDVVANEGSPDDLAEAVARQHAFYQQLFSR